MDREIEAAASLPAGTSADIVLLASVTSQLPHLPHVEPAYSQPLAKKNQERLRFFETETGGIIEFTRPAQIHFDFDKTLATVYLSEKLLDPGNVDDITMVALAPFLRRRGFFLTHAFAAAKETAVLLCGPSGSGKTTTGLALLQAGWRYLANDAALMGHEQGRVYAYPSPGAIKIRPKTLALLPAYPERLASRNRRAPRQAVNVTRHSIFADNELGEKAPIRFVLFPSITAVSESAILSPMPAAIGMARLAEESVDRWDHAAYESHLDLLTLLGRQAAFFQLQVPFADADSFMPLVEEVDQMLCNQADFPAIVQ